MSRQSNRSKQGSYSINEKVGGQNMPVEGAEVPRSFATGTGIRKYDKNDKSVLPMRRQRAKDSRKYGVGVPGGGGLALMSSEMGGKRTSSKPNKKTKSNKPNKNYIKKGTFRNTYKGKDYS